MSEISGLSLKLFLETYENFHVAGLKTSKELLASVDLPTRPKLLEFYPWDSSIEFMEACWQELDSRGTNIEDFSRFLMLNTGSFGWLIKILGYFGDTLDLYRAHTVWTSRLMFRNLESLFEQQGDDKLRVVVSAPHRFRGSDFFFQICSYGTQYLPVRAGHALPNLILRNHSDRHFEVIVSVKPRKARNMPIAPKHRSLVNEILTTKNDNQSLRNDFLNVFRSVPEGLAILAREQLVDANPAFCRIFAVDALHKIVGFSVDTLIPFEKREEFHEWFGSDAGALVMEMTPTSMSIAKVLQFNRAETLNFEGVPSQLLVVRDLTASYSMERLLQSQQKLASVGRISASLSHEIKTPLTVVSSNLQMATDRVSALGITDSELRGYLENAREETQRIQHISANLLSLLRKGDDLLPRSAFELVSETARICKSYARSCGVAIEIERPVSDTAFNVNAFTVIQILVNLLVNAVEATMATEQKVVWIAVENLGNDLLIRVKDFGIGVPDGQETAIFQAFVTSKAQGTGLGLSIARDLAKDFGYQLELESPRRPTIFSLRLPIKAPSQQI